MTSSPHNPDERDLLDFADAVAAGQNPQPRTDEERTYLHVHNAMQGESAAIPSTTKQSTWEDVMSTLALTPEAPVSNRTRKQQELSSPPRVARPRRMQWTPLASVAAALLVVIASFGVWQLSLSPNEPDPPLAPQLAALVPIPASPVATEIHKSAACPDISENTDVSIVESTAATNGSGSNTIEAWLEPNGDVKARCPDGTELLLAEGMDELDAIENTHIVSYGQIDPRGAKVHHHLQLGSTITEYRALASSYLADVNSFGNLRVIVSESDPSQWSVMNLRTMEESTLEALTGHKISSSQRITVSTTPDQSAIAIAVSQYEAEDAATVLRIPAAPGEIVVISDDLVTSYWVLLPDDLVGVNKFSLSDDGKGITLIVDPGLEPGEDDWISKTIDVETGEIVND